MEFPDELAREITAISTALRKLKSSRLNERAIVVLIRDRVTGIGIPAIKAVLDSVENLDAYYLKKAKEPNHGKVER